MKRIILVFAALAMSAAALSARPTGFTLGGGFLTDFYNLSSSLVELDSRPFYGAYFELGYAHEFTKNHTLYIGGRYSEGLDVQVSATSYAAGSTISDRGYLDIPLKYQYQFYVSPTTRLYIEAGATANFWLINYTRGDILVSSGSTVKSETGAINWFEKYSDCYNRANVALGGAFGVYFKHVKIYAGYDYRMIPFVKDASSSNCNSSQLRIGACYVF